MFNLLVGWADTILELSEPEAHFKDQLPQTFSVAVFSPSGLINFSGWAVSSTPLYGPILILRMNDRRIEIRILDKLVGVSFVSNIFSSLYTRCNSNQPSSIGMQDQNG